MKIYHTLGLFMTMLLAALVITSCGSSSVLPTAEVPSATPMQLPSPTTSTGTQLASPAVSPLPQTTQITIDGNPLDWTGNETLIVDPAGDSSGGGFDIAKVRAFTNDTFLYVLIETEKPATDFIQLDLDIRSGKRTFVISFFLGTENSPYMGETSTGKWEDVGEVNGSLSALGEAVEIKMPLFYFDDPADLELLNIRPMNGQCCGSGWYAIDQIEPQRIANLNETEPASGLANLPPSVCSDQIAAAVPFGLLEPASITLSEPGFSAEWFVVPGTFNMPLDILLTPQGDMLVLAVRNFALFRLDENGNATRMANDINGYQGDIDDQGNVYLHFMPDGKITRVTPNGISQILVQSPLIRADCDSGFGFGPDGNMYAAITPCPDAPYLLQITTSGKITLVKDDIPEMIAIRTSPEGRLIGAGPSGVYEISLDDFLLTKLNQDPIGNISSGGMAFDNDGNIYLASGQRSNSGLLRRMDRAGHITEITKIPHNGISGIEWLDETNEIVGGQLRQGGILAVKPDGTIREIVPGNGIITPMGMAFSPCGELLVANDDGGSATLIDPAGEVSWFMDYLSFQPPIPYLSFAADGTLYASEAAPGLSPVRVAVKAPQTPVLQTLIEANYPSGLAYSADGSLFVSETSAGRILQVQPDGSFLVFAEGLHYPTALTLDPNGNLYVVVASNSVQTPSDHPPTSGDKILQIKLDGSQSLLANLSRVVSAAFGPDGNLYATAGDRVYRISPEGKASPFATGFMNSIGLAFDLAGNLYVSDERLNGIVRIAGFSQGALVGNVGDNDGNPISGARVQVLATDPIVVGQIAFTDDNGYFRLPVTPRAYALSISKAGYQASYLENVLVQIGQETAIEITLQKEQ